MNNKYVQQFKKGSLEMILLCLIGRKETYGYEIITELNNSASVLGYAKEGTIYPILYRLQEAELIKCRLAPAAANGGSKKYYSLTDKGRNLIYELILFMAFFEQAITVLQTLVIALGAGLGIWGVINLLEGYGNDNPGANAHVR